jgi:hypothetical protein
VGKMIEKVRKEGKRSELWIFISCPSYIPFGLPFPPSLLSLSLLSLSVRCLCMHTLCGLWRSLEATALLSFPFPPAPRLLRGLSVLFAAQSSSRPKDSRDMQKSRQYARATHLYTPAPPQPTDSHHLPSASPPLPSVTFGDRPSAMQWPVIFGDRPAVYPMEGLFRRVLHPPLPILLSEVYPKPPVPSCSKNSNAHTVVPSFGEPQVLVAPPFPWPSPCPPCHMSQAPQKLTCDMWHMT